MARYRGTVSAGVARYRGTVFAGVARYREAPALRSLTRETDAVRWSASRNAHRRFLSMKKFALAYLCAVESFIFYTLWIFSPVVLFCCPIRLFLDALFECFLFAMSQAARS